MESDTGRSLSSSRESGEHPGSLAVTHIGADRTTFRAAQIAFTGLDRVRRYKLHLEPAHVD